MNIAGVRWVGRLPHQIAMPSIAVATGERNAWSDAILVKTVTALVELIVAFQDERTRTLDSGFGRIRHEPSMISDASRPALSQMGQTARDKGEVVMPIDQSRLAQFMDEASIRNAVARFADSATRADLDQFRGVWAEDGEFIIGKGPHGQSAIGVDDIVAMYQRLRANREFFVQFAVPGVIEIQGDEATTRTLCHEAARGPGDVYYRNHCVAFDRLRRSADGWIFVSRSFQYLWLDTSPFSGNGFALFPDGAET